METWKPGVENGETWQTNGEISRKKNREKDELPC